MKQGRFTDEQIVRISRETDQDSVAEVAKRRGITPKQRLAMAA